MKVLKVKVLKVKVLKARAQDVKNLKIIMQLKANIPIKKMTTLDNIRRLGETIPIVVNMKFKIPKVELAKSHILKSDFDTGLEH